MNDVQRKRREAHYSTSINDSEPVKKSGFKIFIQLLVCMALISGVLYGGTHKLSVGQSFYAFISKITTTDSDISKPYALLHSFVQEKIGPQPMPAPEDSSVFNENTPVSASNDL